MKSQYHFDIAFIRLAAKTDAFTNLRLVLVVDLTKNTPALKNKYYHALRLERQQKILNLKQLEPFRLTIDQQDAYNDSYSIEIKDDQSGQPVQIIHIPTNRTLRNFQVEGKICNDQRHQGTYINLNYKVLIAKALPQNPTLQTNNSKQQGKQLKQTLTRSRRPPMLTTVASKKSQLKQTQRLRQQALKEQDPQLQKVQEIKPMFQGWAENKRPKSQQPKQQQHHIKLNLVQRKQDSTAWQPLSAIPQQLSAWLKRKVRPTQHENHYVSQLLQSHHPDDHDVPTSKLSIKLKIVIVMLILGFIVLVMDMLKKQTYKLFYGKYPKPAKSKSSSKPQKSSSRHQKGQKLSKSKSRNSRKSRAKQHT